MPLHSDKMVFVETVHDREIISTVTTILPAVKSIDKYDQLSQLDTSWKLYDNSDVGYDADNEDEDTIKVE